MKLLGRKTPDFATGMRVRTSRPICFPLATAKAIAFYFSLIVVAVLND